MSRSRETSGISARSQSERTLLRLLNGRAEVSASVALALEELGRGAAGHWMRMQASCELAQARRRASERATAVHHT